jgi:hypothetical protein
MVQTWCVHVAVSAVNVFCAVCAIRKAPLDVCTSARAPTVASGDVESTVTVTPPVLRTPVTTGSAVAEPPGDVGLLHPSTNVASGPSTASEAARLQNVRRFSIGMIFSVIVGLNIGRRRAERSKDDARVRNPKVIER